MDRGSKKIMDLLSKAIDELIFQPITQSEKDNVKRIYKACKMYNIYDCADMEYCDKYGCSRNSDYLCDD
jgi:hypothetical protein